MNKFQALTTLILATLIMISCEKNRDAASGSSGESILQVLEERGQYGQFIKALQLSGYDKLVDGGGLVTVFAPDDAAFTRFLSTRYPTDDVAEIPADELKVLTGYHLIQFAYEPKDFLAFSQSSDDRSADGGDGSSYKYKTYGKSPVQLFTDPRTGRKVNLYSREKFLPILSSKLFTTRHIQDPEADYRRYFPDVEWAGTENVLYSGNACVKEMGVQAVNGFLYTVDKVLEPLPTIYETLSGDGMEEYSIIKEMFDRINTYTYDASLTKNYSPDGDSLFLFYHWTAPSKTSEIPEIASEWTYHNENGVAFVNDTKFTNLCFFPKDEVLEPWLKNYFKELGTYDAKNFLDVIPDNAIYHFLKSHIYSSQEMIYPSELDGAPVIGPNGEKYALSSDNVDPHFCTNGIIFGTDQILMPAVYSHMTETIFREPDFDFYSRAFNVKNMYQQTVDDNNRFTLFIQDDTDLNSEGYISGVSSTTRGSYTFKKSGKNLSEANISDMLMSEFMYGQLPDMEDIADQRYFVAKDNKTYFYVKDKVLYDALDKEIPIRRKIEASNGTVIQTGRTIPARNGGFAASSSKTEFTQFRKLMQKAGLGNAAGGLINSLAGMSDAVVFLPVNQAVVAAAAKGYIPENVDTLKMYLKYHFIQLKKNKLDNFLLPGLGPDGMTEESYTGEFTTMSDYVVEDDMKKMTVSWNPSPESARHLTISDGHGNSIDTVDDRIELRTNSAVYAIESCFDYREIFRRQSL